MVDKDEYRATVEKIVQGKHGLYAVTRSREFSTMLGLSRDECSITFSLRKGVWDEEELPEPGTEVVLSRLRKKTAGWRAQNARFVEPSDDQQPRS